MADFIDITALLTDFGENVVNGLHQNLEDEGLGSSSLAQSLTYDIDANRIVISAAPYWDYAEKGRGPGKVPYEFEDILITWMRKYGVTPYAKTGDRDKDERIFANAIKWNIIKKGSSIYRGDRPERFFERTVIDDNLEWLESQAADVVMKRMGDLLPA